MTKKGARPFWKAWNVAMKPLECCVRIGVVIVFRLFSYHAMICVPIQMVGPVRYRIMLLGT